jgi:hypothetical protein
MLLHISVSFKMSDDDCCMTPSHEFYGGLTSECGNCGNCSVCGFSFNRTASGISDMTSGIDAFVREQDSDDQPIGDLDISVDQGLYEITILNGSETLQYPEDHQLQSLCDSLSQIKDCEIIESLLEKINVKFNRCFNINFYLRKGEDGTNILEFLMQ